MSANPQTGKKVADYLAHAYQALDTGRLVYDHEDYVAAVNRAYYAMFYAASALLASQGLERSKHSGVIADFRQYFVKTGIIEPEYSRIYGAAMDERHAGDYGLLALDRESAAAHLEHAGLFVQRIQRALKDIADEQT